jgi:hypothetical protein
VLLNVQLSDKSGFDLCEVPTREETPPVVLLVSGNNHAEGVRAERAARAALSRRQTWRQSTSAAFGDRSRGPGRGLA